ncbi:MAG: hypothetical protein GWP91_21180 [Rhodobacterales bacterium]|nr:hypothetical protein [Rhodobacterales bacterium]
MNRLWSWWRTQDADSQVQWTGVVMCMALFCVHQVVYAEWFIEDAAITFTYARHAATGEGWTAYPGGPWVEGFSNPTWTALLAATDFIGPGPWMSAKLYGCLFGVLTLPMAFLWAKEVSGDRGLLPVVAPLVLATSPQFAIWTASGLENALFGWLLALGSVELLREMRTHGTPWSALPFGLLSITRPEAAMYVAVAGILAFVLTFRERKGPALLRLIVWTGLVLTPFLIYEAYRMWVFAWPLANTYYAKLATEEIRFHPLNWNAMGWPYLRGWALESGWGFILPFFALVATGLREFPGNVGKTFTIGLILLFIPGLAWLSFIPGMPDFTEPELIVRARLGLIIASILLLPWLTTDRLGTNARVLAWYLAAVSIGFALYSGGDWMDGYRWLNMGIVPLAVLLTDGLVLAANSRSWRAPVHAKRMITAIFAGPIIVLGVWQTGVIRSATETSPHDVRRRVVYMQTVQDRLHVDHINNLEVDFGAQMWWTGDRLIDLPGLVDAPMAHHSWQRPFVREYLFQENPPDFAHVHGSWQTRTGVSVHPEWRRDYIQLPHYFAGRRYVHIGNWINKRLFVDPQWPGTDARSTTFTNRITLTGFDIPAPQVAAGHGLYIHLGWQSHQSRRPGFRVMLYISGQGRFWVQDIPVGYDWYPPAKWRRTEVVQGRHTLRLPADLPAGDYAIGLAMVNEVGGVVPAQGAAKNPEFATGEVRWEAAFTVTSEAKVADIVHDKTQQLITLAQDGACEAADQQLQETRRHLPSHHPSQPYGMPEVDKVMAECWAHIAKSADDDEAVTAIDKARQWDHHNAVVLAVAEQLANQWEAQGDVSANAGDDTTAYASWRRTLIADPTRMWVVRRAEEARDRRLKLESR